jgi:transposase-like protein
MEKTNQNRSRNFDRKFKRDKKQHKVCPFCGSEMKAKGASDSAGSLSYKCRSAKCGRLVWVRSPGSPPLIPLVPFSRVNNYNSKRR